MSKLQHVDPLAVTIAIAMDISGLGRTKLYELIAKKEIKTVRVGVRRLVVFESLKAFLTTKEA
jgi:excisionase family DNA binding protein